MASTPTSALARHRQLAPNASVRVSPLCLGAMTFGASNQARYGEIDKDTVFQILDHFYEQGGNFIDTANVYHSGESEEWVGEWIGRRQNRDELVLATKYSYPYKADANLVTRSNLGGNGIKSMRLSIDASLKRLNTTYIDLFYAHYWDHATSIPELMHGLNDLVISGKVLYLGISDTPAWFVSKANQYARDHGLRQFVVYQGMWSAVMRDFEREIVPMCASEGMGMCPFGVLNQGRFQTEAGFKEREKHNPGRNFVPLSEKDKQVSKILERVGKSKGVDLLHVALAYILHKAPYVFPIVGGRKIEHIMGSITALSVALSGAEIEEIESAYEFDHGFPHNLLSGTLFNHDRSRAVNHPAELYGNKNVGEIDWVGGPQPICPS